MMFPQYTPRALGCFNKINSKTNSLEMYRAETVLKVNNLIGSSLDAMRLAAEQTLYRLMGNRLGTLWLRNPGSEGIADHSPECLMPQDMPKSKGFIGRYGV